MSQKVADLKNGLTSYYLNLTVLPLVFLLIMLLMVMR